MIPVRLRNLPTKQRPKEYYVEAKKANEYFQKEIKKVPSLAKVMNPIPTVG